jgi:hypothetical protein
MSIMCKDMRHEECVVDWCTCECHLEDSEDDWQA